MKSLLYIAVFVFITMSCSTTRNFSNAMEDDIYFVPGKKSLVLQEVENMTGQETDVGRSSDLSAYPETTSRSRGSSTPPATFSPDTKVINRQTGKTEQVNIHDLTNQATEMLADNNEINTTLYSNTGYWIGGYKGNASDLEEIQRIINMYPNGFGFFSSNGQDIALNLSFDPDWNVYTDDGRFWWFPSNTNIEFYSSLLFGTYPKYIWTVVWDNPRFDSWAFNNTFNNWGFRFGWSSPGWGLSFGWNSGWYDPWYAWNGSWYNPWYGYYPGWGPGWGYHPHWHHPHWNYPHWGGGSHRPDWGTPGNRPHRPITGLRPNNGGGSVGSMRPNNGNSYRPGSSTTRPNTGNMVRPGSTAGSGISRPNSGSVTRPNTVRPNTPTITRPGTQPNVRPGTPASNDRYTRPTVQPTTRPTTRPTTQPTTRPTTRPSNTGSQYSRPTTPNRPTQSTNNRYTRPSGNSNQYTRPSTTNRSSGNVKNYSRPQNNYRPTYNNNSTSNYTPPRRSSSGSSYMPSRSNNGNRGVSRPTPTTRPTRR